MIVYRRSLSLPGLALCALLALAACESAEERAERHFQSGMELLEQGDVDRALIEFRNVFDLDGKHREARKTYARLVRERGEMSEAYGQYLRLVEQYPDDLEGRRALGEMALEQNRWEEVRRHVTAGLEHHPDDPALQILETGLAYRQAMEDEDSAAREELAGRLREQIENSPENLVARRFLIAHLLSGMNPTAALPEIDAALELQDDDFKLHVTKLKLLELQADDAGIEAELKEMFRIFPDNQDVRGALISWYVNNDRIEEAETFMRDLAEGVQDPGPHLAIVHFLRTTRGDQAALAELDRLVTGNPEMEIYRSARAAMKFDMGRQDEALAAFEEILQDAEPSESTRRIKLTYAGALVTKGDVVGARALVEEVLAEDASNVDALKMKAAWLIDDDRPGDAILALRRALDQDPADPAILTLMARAHERDGSRDLAGERLSLAVDISNRAPAESLRYAKFLVEDDRPLAAESVVIDALRLAPENLALLETLGEIYLVTEDWPRAQGVVDRLRRLQAPRAGPMANELQSRLLLRQGRVSETVEYIDGLIEKGEAGISAKAEIVRTLLRDGDAPAAAEYLDGELAAEPGNPALRHLRAGVHRLSGELAEAETIYRDLLAEDPSYAAPARALILLLLDNGRDEEADDVLAAAIEANPEKEQFQWLKAQRLEKTGDADGAIAIYEALYEKDSDNPILANNLASLITTHRTDDESLRRAFTISRRLRGTDVPAFQDTYGWIAYRRGDLEEARSYLEAAASALPEEPLVQYHAGVVYAAAGEADLAREALRRAADLAGENRAELAAQAREALARIGQEAEKQ